MKDAKRKFMNAVDAEDPLGGERRKTQCGAVANLLVNKISWSSPGGLLRSCGPKLLRPGPIGDDSVLHCHRNVPQEVEDAEAQKLVPRRALLFISAILEIAVDCRITQTTEDDRKDPPKWTRPGGLGALSWQPSDRDGPKFISERQLLESNFPHRRPAKTDSLN